MSCFNNLFNLTKDELVKLINSMDKSIDVSKFKKNDLF